MATPPLPHILPFLVARTWHLDFATITGEPPRTSDNVYHCYTSLDLSEAFSYDDPSIHPRVAGPATSDGRPPAVSLWLFLNALVPGDLTHWRPHITLVECDLMYDKIYWDLVQRLRHHSNTLIKGSSLAVFRLEHSPPHSPLFLDVTGDGASSLKSIIYALRGIAYSWAGAHSPNTLSFRTPLIHMSLSSAFLTPLPFPLVE